MKLTLDTLPMYCHEEGDCLLWAQGLNSTGYPQANVGGRIVLVRRYVYRELCGLRAGPRQPISARCGQKLCVSPRCLFSSTAGDVLTRAYALGFRSRQNECLARQRRTRELGWAKLSDDDVVRLRALGDDVSNAEAGRMFGVSAQTARRARRGVSWRKLVPGASAFTWGAA